MPPGQGEEHRRFGRIRLEEPLRGTIGDVAVDVVELSLSGFRILHEARFPAGQPLEIRLDCEGWEMRFVTEVVRGSLFRLGKGGGEKSVYQSGLQIDEAVGDSEQILREFIARRVIRALEEQKANARGMPLIGAYMHQVGKGDRFRRCELTDGTWRKFDTTRPEQPAEGFTISAETDPRQIDLLCRTYETTTEEGRRLTRILAELSIRKTEGGPTRRYVP